MKPTPGLQARSIIFWMLILFAGCKSNTSDPEPSASIQLRKLSHTWKITEVTLDGVDKTSDYSGFELLLEGDFNQNNFTYSTSGRPAISPWPANGNWTFGTVVENEVLRDQGTENELSIQYVVDENVLQLTTNFQGDGYASRSKNVSGQWVFTFTL
jgi:hypothetical protein